MRGTFVKHTRAFMKNGGAGSRHVFIPNLLTTGNLFSGLFSILSVFNANYMNAAIAILVAVVFDMLDGKSARWTNSTSQFGVEYDSLADLVSFGVAPGLLDLFVGAQRLRHDGIRRHVRVRRVRCATVGPLQCDVHHLRK